MVPRIGIRKYSIMPALITGRRFGLATTVALHLARLQRIAPALGSLALALAAGSCAYAQTYAISTLTTFTGTANGANPYVDLTLDSSGNLFGTTRYGGANNDGTVFEIAAGTSTLTTIVNFSGNLNGRFPVGTVTLDSSGNVYGTTDSTAFEIAAGTNQLTTLATFTGTANGSSPYAGVTFDSSGNLYGTTYFGGANNDGTVFEIAASTNALTTLVTFNGANGVNPKAGLTLDSSGNLYGTTEYGGAVSGGTVFKISAGPGGVIGGGTFTTLHDFTDIANGSHPFGGVTLDSSGNLYGTSLNGGAGSNGTVFKIAAATNSLTTLANFNGAANGSGPYGGVTLDSSGNLYGTTYQGGANDLGTVFRLTVTGGASAPEPAVLLLVAPSVIGVVAARRRRA
jgi:uncharacterized repeat protein (TIGR03803 family)